MFLHMFVCYLNFFCELLTDIFWPVISFEIVIFFSLSEIFT